MKLTLLRDTFTSKSTTGELSINGAAFCWTLELPVKDGLPGSCIPPGTYNVITYPSPHFKRLMPLLVGIPGRSEIEMHWGESPLAVPRDTRGCIIVGGTRPVPDALGQSQQIFYDFWAKAQGPMERGDCWIQVIGGGVRISNVEDVQDAVTGEN